jgi:hypothetical protein
VTAADVLALASARKLLALAHDTTLIWGECQGSGKAPYRVCANLGTLAYSCSCPSRKFPCKHVLGALLAHVNGGAANGPPPDWVLHWHAERVAKLQRAAALATAAPDAASATVAKRAQPRERRVAAGLAECDRWLRDVTRLGFAHARVQPAAFWEARAARLVDAQCPGVARRVRALAGIIVSGPRWEDRALTALGEIPLL